MQASLSAVIIVYNEPRWIEVTVSNIVTAVERSDFEDVELVIVDDGSDAETKAVLANLEVPLALRVVSQENKGRFDAMEAGIRAAKGDLVLTMGSRVFLDPGALEFISRELAQADSLPVWNALCGMANLDGNPYARFWDVLTQVAYAKYFEHPRHVSYGIEEFDYYPKGTGGFLAPRTVLLEALDNFETHYEDRRNSNDDTSLIRQIAEKQPINISPEFTALYWSRTSFRPFFGHAYHRGIHFVDGWSNPGGRFFLVLAAFYPSSLLGAALALRRPRLAFKLSLAAPIVAGLAGRRFKRSTADCAALSMLSVPWLLAYSAGLWRGLGLVIEAKLKRR